MPMWDFECSSCGKIQELFYKEDPGSVPCACGGLAYYKPSFWYTSPLNAQRFSPVVIHRDAQGNIRFPATPDAPLPPGYHKEELTNFYQVRRLENEVNAQERAKIQEHHFNRTRSLDAQLKENREAMKELVSKFSPKGRRFYEAMRQASEAQMEKFRSRPLGDSNFYVEAFSMDASNREDYRDARNDWGKFGSGRK